ncbi:Alkaline ceramidase [Aphelenchoides bicaudatus]|nr:Alkaline ceramidase [Aphelenchoides bicaudatus]
MDLMDSFKYETGMPWCESAYKYQTLPFVAEFANTVTNLPIIVLPMLNAFMLRDYITQVNSIVFLPHLLLTFNGLASTAYHATISLFGQLVDELSILWLINICLVAFLPIMQWVPDGFRKRMNTIRWTIVGVTAAISVLCFIRPSLNAFALMTFSIPGSIVIYQEGIKNNQTDIEKFTRRVFILWTLALSFWVADRVFCPFWLYLGAPYLHAIFHLLSSLAGYNAFIMFSLLDISRRSNEHNFHAEIRYFPSATKQPKNRFCFPYIRIVDKKKMIDH